MKKFFFSILAVGAMVACTKSEVNYNDASEISFAPVTATSTKAAVQGAYYPTEIPFNVFSFYAVGLEPKDLLSTEDYAQFTKTYLDNKKFEYNSAAGLFGGAEHAYYWPKTGSLVFAGYSPDNSKFTSESQTYSFADGLTITGYKQSANTEKTKDLMWFNHTTTSFRGRVGVPVTFTHACSWLSFYVTSATEDADFHVKKLVLNGVEVKGNLSTKDGVAGWTLLNDKQSVVVLDGDVDVPTESTMVKIDNDGVIVLPQPCVSATITYSMNNGAGVVVDQTETFDLSAGTTGTEWLYGKHYTYTIKFSASEILISPTVLPWDEVNGDMVVVD